MSTQPGKSPGPDGLTVSYYKTFSVPWSVYFLKDYNSVGEGAYLPRDTLRAYSSLIHKEGKDPTQCSSNQPISLLNADLKLFAKILGSRVATEISDIVHYDQVGFIRTREAKDSVIRFAAPAPYNPCMLCPGHASLD